MSPAQAVTEQMHTADSTAPAVASGAAPLPSDAHPHRFHRRRKVSSARTRILGWYVLLLASSLVVSTAAVHVVLNHSADQRIAADLQHEIDEFDALRASRSADSGPHSVMSLLRSATSRAVPESVIILIGIADGRVVSTSSNISPATLGLTRADLHRFAITNVQTVGNVRLGSGMARAVAIPIRAAGDSTRATLVAAVLSGPEHAAVWRVTWLTLEAGAVSLLIASLLAWVVAGRVLRPIRATTELARRITDADLSERLPVHGGTEVNEMAATFNAMLDRLQATFVAHRRFLADAGHELRTPITIIQGNLDTLTVDNPDDSETLAVVNEELDRMTRLVEELSLLAAMERPDFLRPAATDLAQLGPSLTSKIKALSDRPWHTTIDGSDYAMLDAQRITQAVLQLASNALAYTAPDVALELGIRTAGNDLELTVIDHGDGIPAADRERVFQRFVRLSGSRAQSTGLGLSIVAAIASAHGGTASASETPGGGTTMTLRLPLWRAVMPSPGGTMPTGKEVRT